MRVDLSDEQVKALSRALVVEFRREGFRGVHVVFGGANAALRELGVEPREFWRRAEDLGAVVVRPARRGAIAYLSEDAPAPAAASAEVKAKLQSALERAGLGSQSKRSKQRTSRAATLFLK